eukprot:TRINITY_DN5466_c0_g2_i1.p2 TRINITY_DN5466_c0_g2~~TRINITY_DN5466_c0_g2_i1.p2  ORF type:complete len:302 (+),score=71.44 TRINITY_DN5466_c0_g2_i1:2119-3024(+)
MDNLILTRESMSKKYESGEIYKMVTLVLHYPEAGHSGKQFWTSMMGIYEDSILTGRNAGALREKWRKIAKEHSTDLEEYKKKLVEELPKEFVDEVESVIVKKLAEPNQDPISHKRRSAPLPNIFKGEGVQKMEPILQAMEVLKMARTGNEKEGEPVLKKTKQKKPSLGRVRVGNCIGFLEDIRTCIDLSLITPRKAIGISKTVRRLGYSDLDADARDFLSRRSDSVTAVQGLLQITRELEPVNRLPKLPVKPLEQTLKADEGWSELEDVALRHTELKEVQECLVKIKGAAAVEQRRKMLGI